MYSLHEGPKRKEVLSGIDVVIDTAGRLQPRIWVVNGLKLLRLTELSVDRLVDCKALTGSFDIEVCQVRAVVGGRVEESEARR